MLIMKNGLLYCAILLLHPMLISAQKFVSTDNRWYLYDLGTTKYYSKEYAAFFKDSTYLNGHFYHQLYRTVDSAYRHIEPTKMFYREEAGIVYRLDNTDNSEDTIYNFNLKTGESITYGKSQPYDAIAIVYSVDTVTLIDGSKRRQVSVYNPRFLSGGYYIRRFIDGIGAIETGTFNPELMFYGFVAFRCFYHKGKYLFGVQEGSCRNTYENFPLSVNKIQELEGLQLIQNTGDGTIAFQIEYEGKYQCKVYNAQGVEMFTPLVQRGYNRISTTTLPKGIYFVQVYDPKNLRQKTLKFVHQ